MSTPLNHDTPPVEVSDCHHDPAPLQPLSLGPNSWTPTSGSLRTPIMILPIADPPSLQIHPCPQSVIPSPSFKFIHAQWWQSQTAIMILPPHPPFKFVPCPNHDPTHR
ncbi:hypothetical protein BDR04DRAFT_1158196 [Suillus decipiens]|nr:hypothetical protein BDR04DRAFT_1158196 [Suillus decipiens]